MSTVGAPGARAGRAGVVRGRLGRGRWEAAAWLFMRLSGVALLFLVLGHMLLMHVLVGLDQIDVGFVTARWDGLGWRSYDEAMLLLALLHGAGGVRGLSYEHFPARARAALVAAGYAACLAVAGFGSWVIVTFAGPI
jgi:succinate dehydrogenase / fumarate reductase membrane anchor subunit